ncbi:hypothetical protein LguiA_020975 [Lonicera macranthoides]
MAVQRDVGELVKQKEEQGSSVLYVTFGSLAEISKEQFREISKGLEESEVNFLWVVRKNEEFDYVNEFEERVRERGMIVREWVNQREILGHESMKGFLSHCEYVCKSFGASAAYGGRATAECEDGREGDQDLAEGGGESEGICE